MSDWKKDLRDRFEDFREQEPEGLWSAIEAEIAPKKKALPLWWIAAVPAAAAVAALFLLPGRGVDTPASRSSEALVEVVPSEAPDASDASPADTAATLQEMLERLETKRIVADIPARKTLPATAGTTVPQEIVPASAAPVAEEETVPEESVIRDVTEKQVAEQQAVEKQAAEKPAAEQQAPVAEAAAWDPSTIEDFPEEIIDIIIRPRQRFSIRLSRTAGIASSSVTQGYGSGPLPATRALAPGASDETGYMTRLLTSNRPTTTEAAHQQPVRFGLTFGYSFARNWSAEAGLYHTTLRSDFTSGTESVYTLASQRLDCFGIPLHLRYQLTDASRLLSLYAIAGGSWEKGYKLTVDNRYYLGGTMQDQSRETSTPSFTQWTADAGLGLQVRLDRKGFFALYAEPGVAYHFKNGSEIRTVYSDKPLSPSLTVGLRMLINP